MAKTDNPRGIAKVARELKKKTPLLEQLQPGEAALVLSRLLAGHPELLPEAEEIARSTLSEVSFESIASEGEDSIRQLSLDDLDSVIDILDVAAIAFIARKNEHFALFLLRSPAQ